MAHKLENLDENIQGLRSIIASAKRSAFVEIDLQGVTGFVRIEPNRKSGIRYADIGLFDAEFYRLLYDRVPSKVDSSSAILSVKSGMLNEPFRPVMVEPTQSGYGDLVADQVARDSRLFFLTVPSMNAALEELKRTRRSLPNLEPLPGPRAMLFAAVLAYLLKEPWEPLLEAAKCSKIASFNDWASLVGVRLAS